MNQFLYFTAVPYQLPQKTGKQHGGVYSHHRGKILNRIVAENTILSLHQAATCEPPPHSPEFFPKIILVCLTERAKGKKTKQTNQPNTNKNLTTAQQEFQPVRKKKRVKNTN